jgi:hypothetical protein
MTNRDSSRRGRTGDALPEGRQVIRHARRQPLVGVVECLAGQGQLLEIIRALRTPGRLSCRLHGRQEKPYERADNGDHDQKFDKRKPWPRECFSVHRMFPSVKTPKTDGSRCDCVEIDARPQMVAKVICTVK